MIENLTLTKEYHSQHTTRISNGGLLTNSDRALWEEQLFGSHYTSTDIPLSSRPKYGALSFLPSSFNYGAAPRFGPCHLRLRPTLLDRASFCFPDSYHSPTLVGTARHSSNIVRVALQQRKDWNVPDWYIEAHVHGPLMLDDVEAIVLDPSYKSTGVEDAARRLGCSVEWHAGYKVDVDVFDSEEVRSFRGANIAEVAKQIARDGVLTPALLGWAYEQNRFELQEIKYVWHCLARFGAQVDS